MVVPTAMAAVVVVVGDMWRMVGGGGLCFVAVCGAADAGDDEHGDTKSDCVDDDVTVDDVNMLILLLLG